MSLSNLPLGHSSRELLLSETHTLRSASNPFARHLALPGAAPAAPIPGTFQRIGMIEINRGCTELVSFHQTQPSHPDEVES